MPSPKTVRPKSQPRRPAVPSPRPAPPARQFLVRCTFLGEAKGAKLDGSFRFLCVAEDSIAALAQLEPAIRKLRRAGELPPRCDVYVEFVLELAELRRGVIADFERWEREPKRFQHGCITFSDTCAVYHHERTDPFCRFGSPPR